MWLRWCCSWFQWMAPSSPSVRDDATTRGGWFSGLGRGKSWPITPVTGVGEALWCRRDKYSSWLQPLSNSAPVRAVQKYTQCSGNTAEIQLQCRLCAQTLALLLSYSLQLSGAVRGGAICRKRWADEDAPSPLDSFLVSKALRPNFLLTLRANLASEIISIPIIIVRELLYHLKLH